jgi:G3E family GTPase
VIVNDFGSLAIDASLLAAAAGDELISLPNGCVCCTVGAGLHEALGTLAAVAPPLDHVLIEVSGVADPSVAAAWGTVAPFESGGVIVLADATSVVQRSRDRFVGGEVTRQLAGADLVVITKVDICDEPELVAVERWIGVTSGGAPSIRVIDGEISTGVILGARPERAPSSTSSATHDACYASWSWTSEEVVPRAVLDSFLSSLPPGVLRVKGWVHLDDGTWVDVQVVGRRVEVTPRVPGDRTAMVAIAVRSDSPVADPFVVHFGRPASPQP